ncbi:MAG: metallophosphoesterase [Gracilibacter sp. BRH_c7a]|nr:MAG: metallophosphoesterase [Gracilibacter sp. BRH_c7a]
MGGIGMVSYLYFDLHSIAIKQYTVTINNLPKDFEGFTILHLTDLHAKEYGYDQNRLLGLINSQKFDMVALTGDFIDKNNINGEPLLSLVRGLISKPIFFVPGNHEWSTEFGIRASLDNYGVRVLENKKYKYSKGNSHIWITGVDDPYLRRDKLDEALYGISDSQPKVLLAHAPNIFPSAAKQDVGLVLVGHTHGGQVRLPIVGAIVAPGQGLFPKYDYGLFTSGSTKMIINGGLGESVLPIRFYNRPEIVLVKLVSSG